MTDTEDSNERQIQIFERPSLLGDEIDEEGLYIIIDTLSFGTTLSYLFDSYVNSVSIFPDESSLKTFMDGNETHLPLMDIKPTNTNFLPNSAPKIRPETVNGYDIAATSDHTAEILYETIGIDKFVIFASSTNASAVIKEAYSMDRDIYLVCASEPLETRREDLYIAKYIKYGIQAKENLRTQNKYKRKQRFAYLKFKYYTKILLLKNKILPTSHSQSEIEYIQQINRHRSVPARVDQNVFFDITRR